MLYELTIEERDLTMENLTAEQRDFIHNRLVRGRRTLFARQLARKKCQFIPEDAEFEDIEGFIEEWDYIGFTDSGEVSPLTKCECGRSLRYQHRVKHLPTHTIRYLGIEHLQQHTGIDAKAVALILKGFDVLDAEMNEVLHKVRSGWRLDEHIFLPLPSGLNVPQDIQEQIDAGLPLLGRQLIRLRGRLRELEQASRERRIAAAIGIQERHRSGLENKGSDADPQAAEAGAALPQSPGNASMARLPGAEASAQSPYLSAENAVSGQAAFDFDEDMPQQAAFAFESDALGQAAFVFGNEEDSQLAFSFDELPDSKAQTSSAKSEGGGAKEAKDMQPGSPLQAAAYEGALYAPSASNPFYLPPASQKVVEDALPFGRVSTLAVSEFLIQQRLVQDVRMITGKPEIYIAVAAFLDKLSIAGKCELVSADAEDRVYAGA